jgi:hypothetical protein
VLTTTSLADERITTAQQAKLAYVYVRQSSPGQVRHHQESTELQYRLVERAVLLGWPRERVHVIDDDLGKSGASSSERRGFQTLIAEVNEPGCVAARPQQPGLASAPGTVLAVRRADRRWRAAV